MGAMQTRLFDRGCELMGDEIVAGWALDGDLELLSIMPRWRWWFLKQWAAFWHNVVCFLERMAK